MRKNESRLNKIGTWIVMHHRSFWITFLHYICSGSNVLSDTQALCWDKAQAQDSVKASFLNFGEGLKNGSPKSQFVYLRERLQNTQACANTVTVNFISRFSVSSHQIVFQRRAKETCIILDRKTQIYRNPMRNPIPFEYIKIGSAGYWCTNCSVIDVSLFTFAGGAFSQCGVNGECALCVFMCTGKKKRQTGVKT